MTFRKLLIGGCFCLAWTSTGWSHPGHGSTEIASDASEAGPLQTMAHYLTEPVHQWPWVTVLIVLAIASTLVLAQHRRYRAG